MSFCTQDESDSLRHMYECRVVHEMLDSLRKEMQFWILQLPPHRVPTIVYSFGSMHLIARVAALATMIEAWYYTFNWLRHRDGTHEVSRVAEVFRARVLHSCRQELCIRIAFARSCDD